MSEAVLLIFHGSRDPEGNSGVEVLRAEVETRIGLPVYAAHLEHAAPLIPIAVDRAVADGHRRIVMIPILLGAAGHVKKDIPRYLAEARRSHPEIEFVAAEHLGTHAAVLEILDERLGEVERAACSGLSRVETSVVLTARGSSDPEANAEVCRVARLFWEGRGLISVHAAFLGVTKPEPMEAIRRAALLEPRRIVAVPYLLFPGLMQSALEAAAADATRIFPRIEIVVARPLGPDPRVAFAIVERYRSCVAG